MTAAIHEESRQSSRPGSRNRLFHLLIELRRRRVCRAITMYSVAMWLACQIVDVISPALELPEWTLKLVIVFGLLGLPVIIMMSWLFEITPDGLAVESPGEPIYDKPNKTGEPKHIADRLIDLTLILASLAIGVQLAMGAISGIGTAESPVYRIAVTPFLVGAGEEAIGLSEELAIELQHALKQQFGITVIASSDPVQLRGSARLTGTVSANKSFVRVAVTMIDFDSGVVTWSAAFQQPRRDGYTSSADLAQQIVAALPMPQDTSEAVRLANVAQ